MSLKKRNYNVDRRLSRRLIFEYTATAVARTARILLSWVKYALPEAWKTETAEQYSTFLKFVLNAEIGADVAGPASHVTETCLFSYRWIFSYRARSGSVARSSSYSKIDVCDILSTCICLDSLYKFGQCVNQFMVIDHHHLGWHSVSLCKKYTCHYKEQQQQQQQQPITFLSICAG